jgi:ADP-heptose:LPS heptosyltransferase
MRILLIQFKQLGDILMVTPSIRAIKQKYPEASLHFLVNSGCAGVVETHPLLDRVIRYGHRSFLSQVLEFRRANYDVVIDFMGVPKTALISFLTGAGVRIGFCKRGRGLFYTRSVHASPRPVYSAQEKGLLLEPLGISLHDPSPEMFITPGDEEEALELIRRLGIRKRGKLIALSPVSRRSYKMWPLPLYAQACDLLFERRQVSFLPLFGPGEEGVISRVIALSKHPEAFVFPYPPPSFRALKALLRECILYFGNDNGIRHVAIAAGLPTVGLFGRINPVIWTPPDNPMHRTLWGKEGMDKISVMETVGFVEQVLNETLAV